MGAARDDKVECRTPTPGKKPTWIDRWKFEAVKDAILKVVPKREPGVEFRALPKLIEGKLSAKNRAQLFPQMPATSTSVKPTSRKPSAKLPKARLSVYHSGIGGNPGTFALPSP